MTRQSRIFLLQQIAECFEKEHMDTEAEVIRTAIYDIGILDEVKKERDAAIAMAQPEIIRCKDCIYATRHSDGSLWVCGHPDNNAWDIDDMFYCGRAERRTDG